MQEAEKAVLWFERLLQVGFHKINLFSMNWNVSCYLKYSLIKMIYWMCDKSGSPPTWPQLEHAIRRNFGGLDEATLNPLDEFKRNLPCIKEPLDLSQIPPEVAGS